MKKLLIVLAMIGSHWAHGQTASKPGVVLVSNNGRFVFGQISDYKSDQFMLDTQTGRLWQIVCTSLDKDAPSLCGKRALQQIQYIDEQGKSQVAPPSMNLK